MSATITVKKTRKKPPIPLQSLDIGTAFRLGGFAGSKNLPTALSEGTVFRVVHDTTPEKGKILVISLNCELILHMDGDCLVHPHDIEILVSPHYT